MLLKEPHPITVGDRLGNAFLGFSGGILLGLIVATIDLVFSTRTELNSRLVFAIAGGAAVASFFSTPLVGAIFKGFLQFLFGILWVETGAGFKHDPKLPLWLEVVFLIGVVAAAAVSIYFFLSR